MLLGTAGIVFGAPIGYFVVHQWLDPEAWRAFGTLAGSWIGGTGNMAAAKEALETPDDLFGLVILADNVIYIFWLPILLISKGFAERFNRWARVPEDRIAKMEAAVVAEGLHEEEAAPKMTDYLYLAFIASFVTAVTAFLAPKIFQTVNPIFPVLETMLSIGTWSVLLVTTMGIALSFTPAKRIPGSHNLAMAIVYIFVAVMGAGASLDNLGQAPAFLLGCLIWISVHGIFCLIGAWIFRVDVHSVAIASAANVGGAASAPVVAAAHRESLVPVAILMALIGYALGNYLSVFAGHLCRIVVGG